MCLGYGLTVYSKAELTTGLEYHPFPCSLFGNLRNHVASGVQLAWDSGAEWSGYADCGNFIITGNTQHAAMVDISSQYEPQQSVGFGCCMQS